MSKYLTFSTLQSHENFGRTRSATSRLCPTYQNPVVVHVATGTRVRRAMRCHAPAPNGWCLELPLPLPAVRRGAEASTAGQFAPLQSVQHKPSSRFVSPSGQTKACDVASVGMEFLLFNFHWLYPFTVSRNYCSSKSSLFFSRCCCCCWLRYVRVVKTDDPG